MKSRDQVISDIHTKNTQDLIKAVNALENVLRARTLKGAKDTATKALREMGYL